MKTFAKSISYAFIAQIVSLLVSVFMSFFVSRYMQVEEFGYYQLFLFYSTYVGLLQFGASEGIYLENGGSSFDELNFGELKSLFQNVFTIDLLIVIIGAFSYSIYSSNESKKIIIVLICCYAIINLFATYFGMLLQSVNRTELYSLAVGIGKITTLLMFLTLVFLREFSFWWYCVAFVVGHFVTAVIVTIGCKEVICAKIKNRIVFYERRKTIVSGMSLLLSGLTSSFIIGICRIYIEHYRGIESFAKVSMALSLINFFILFSIQIGMVMFPNIAGLPDEKRANIYINLDRFTTYLMPLILICYLPLRLILLLWIPQYEESIHWMLLFLPYMIYEIRTQIMYNTYIKALRKEKHLFLVNLFALLASAIINLIVIKNTDNIELVFIIINIIMIVKSFALSKMIERNYGVVSYKFFGEAILCCTSAFALYYRYKTSLYFIIVTIYVLICLLYTIFSSSVKSNPKHNFE